MMISHGRFHPVNLSQALRLLFLLLLIPFFGVPVSYAQVSPWRVGLYGDLCFNFISGGFNNLPGVGKPPAAFGSTSGAGFGGGAFLTFMPGKLLGGSLRAGYQSLSATQTADEPTFIGINGRPARVIIRHTLVTDFTPIGIDATIIIHPYKQLEIGIGPRLAFVLNSHYQQSQRLIAPVQFVREPDTLSGPIPAVTSPQIALLARLGWELPLNRRKSVVLMPELSGQLGLTNLASGVTWKASVVTFGVSLGVGGGIEDVIRYDTLYHRDTVTSFSIASSSDQVVLVRRDLADQTVDIVGTKIITTTVTEAYRRDVPRPAPVLAGSIKVRFLLPNGTDTEQISLQIRESLVRSFVALPWTIALPGGTASLPPEVRTLSAEETKSFTLDGLSGAGAEAIYRQQLNILGKRLREHPGTTLAILTAVGDSAAGAGAARDYLRDIWRIDESRLKIERGRGEAKGNIELVASDPALAAPVEVIDTMKNAILPGVRFYPTITSEAGIRSWGIMIDQGDRQGVATLSGSDDPPAAIEWDAPAESAVRDPSAYPLRYRFTLEDQAGQRVNVASGSILFERTKYRKATGEIGHAEYSLPADEKFLRDHQDLIRVIRAAIVPGARTSINVYGENGDGEVKRMAEKIARDLDIPVEHIEDIPAAGSGRNIPDAAMRQKRIVISIVEDAEAK